MPTEAERFRDLATAYWAGQTIPCAKHPGVNMTGSFVQTTFADHIFLTCPRGKETITIPQRPRQTEYHTQAVEGMVENIQRGDTNLCYRCQRRVEVATKEDVDTGRADYTFTCTHCFSHGSWSGKPETAKIGSSPTSGTRKKKSSTAIED
ncbi:MAG TPA: hypothetical protein VLU46_08410 [Thermoanaerobaculia bacterium]|nr:hypothetical protein [Thermoanaerobaculia bacterium]